MRDDGDGSSLTDHQRAILDLEVETAQWTRSGAKEQLIRERLDLSATRYYQALISLTVQAEALAYAPAVCARVQRVLAQHRRGRAA